MPDALRTFFDEFILALGPLIDASRDANALLTLLAELGWTPAAAPRPLSELAAVGTVLVDTIGADPATVSTAQVLESLERFVAAINAIGNRPDADFPAGIDVASFKATIGRDLFDHLLVEHLLRNRHRWGGLMRLAGLVRLVEAPAAGLRQPHLKRQVMWASIGALLTDPAQGFRDAFGWPSTEPQLGQAADVLASLLESHDLQLSYVQPSGDLLAFANGGATTPLQHNLGIDLALSEMLGAPNGFAAGLHLLARPATAARGAAISLLPYADLLGAQELALGDGLSLAIRGNVDFMKGVAITLAPGRPIELQSGFLGGASVNPAEIRIELRRTAAPDEPERVLIGTPGASRFSVGAAGVSAGARLVAPGQLDAFVQLDVDNALVAIKAAPGEADSFLSSVLGDAGISARFSFGLRLSSLTGFHLTGSAGLEGRFAVGAKLGPVDVQALSIGLKVGSQGVDLEVGATVHGSVGPVDIVIERLGLGLTTRFPDPPDGNLGPIDLGVGFLQPSGVGLSIDAHGVLTGGGFLFHDPAQGTYAGVMQLSLHDQITLSAYGLIATRMPDGSRGYSLLIFITAEGFKPIPLGFGFMLQAIGGMVGVNRTFDDKVIAAGLKTDSLSTLLLPRDPVSNAPALMQALAAAFPARQGSYLLGLLARITWFTPTLVQLDLALILEFGARTRLLALGRVSALLPSRDNDLIRLNMDALGVLDFDAGSLAVDAVLVDSRLAQQFPITGSAALRARWAGDTNFVLAVGGLNPRFAPPTGFPSLERVAIALCSGSNPRLICDAYLAITANTVQFGSHVSLYAEAIGFSISGDLGFDALVTLLPPHFIVDFHAAVQLKRGSHNLFKVTLDGTLEGPLPLRLSARAKFEILWFSFSVHFDFTLAAGNAAQALPSAVMLSSQLRRALADPASWSTRRSPTLAHGVVLRSLPPGAALVLDPLGQLVVQQQVVPLNTSRDVDTYGGLPVAGPGRFHLAAMLNETAGMPLAAAFAPARYFAMSDDDKLVAPSFEMMDAGLLLGDATVLIDPATIVPAPLRYAPVTLDPPAVSGIAGIAAAAPAALRYALPVGALMAQRTSGAAARVPLRRLGRARFRNLAAAPAASLVTPGWRLVRASDGAVAPIDPALTTWSEQRAALATLNRGGAQWLMVPEHELAQT